MGYTTPNIDRIANEGIRFLHYCGTGTISVDGKQLAQGRIDRTVPFRFSIDETFDVGEDAGTPVSEDYDVPFKFTGQIEKVGVNLGDAKLAGGGQKALLTAETRRRVNE